MVDARQPLTAQPRYPSIDIFRGAVIASMLLVNSIRGRDFAPQTFHHSDWRVGPLTASFADLVFPWFLLAVGLSLPFSMNGGRGRGRSFQSKLIHAAKRSAILFALGGLLEAARIAYHSPPGPITWRTLISIDVLPQIAVAYFAGVILYHCPRWVWIAFILVVALSKWVLLAHWPYPGVGHPVWTPDQNMQNYLRERFPMFKGLHGAMVGSSIVIAGVYIGDRLRQNHRPQREGLLIAAAGVVMIAVSWAWSLDLPFSRFYHTPSWALFSTGTGCVIFGVIHAAQSASWGRPLGIFEPPGRNPLAIYIIAELLWPMVLLSWQVPAADGGTQSLWSGFEQVLARVVGPAAAPWMQVVAYLGAFWLLAWAMMRKRIFVKL